MAAPKITSCKIQGKAITRDVKKFEDCEDELDLTIYTINELLKTNKQQVKTIMAQGNLDANRLIRRKIIYNKDGGKELAKIMFDRPNKEAGIASYLFKKSNIPEPGGKYELETPFIQRHKNDCVTCRNPLTNGPFMECITYSKDGSDELKGACLNCYYTGTPTGCSFRNDAEEVARNKKQVRTWEQIKEELEVATVSELEAWRPVIKRMRATKLQATDKAMSQSQSQKKKK